MAFIVGWEFTLGIEGAFGFSFGAGGRFVKIFGRGVGGWLGLGLGLGGNCRWLLFGLRFLGICSVGCMGLGLWSSLCLSAFLALLGLLCK